MTTCGWDVTVEEEHRRVPQLNQGEIDGILEWASKQPHLPQIPKHRVVMFLRACDFSLEKTKDAIELFYMIRAKVPEVFGNLDVDSNWTQKALRNLSVGMMASEEDFYFYYKFATGHNVSDWNFEEYAKTVFMCVESTHLAYGSRDGYHFIAEVTGFTLSHMLQMSISTVQHVLKYLQEASHYKIKSIHFMNGGSVMERLHQMLKPFISKSVNDMIRIHPGTVEIFQTVDESYVPSEYGGKGPSLKELDAKMKEIVEEKKEWFKKDCQLVADESKKPPSSKCEYGIVGSFRKIAID